MRAFCCFEGRGRAGEGEGRGGGVPGRAGPRRGGEGRISGLAGDQLDQPGESGWSLGENQEWPGNFTEYTCVKLPIFWNSCDGFTCSASRQLAHQVKPGSYEHPTNWSLNCLTT